VPTTQSTRPATNPLPISEAFRVTRNYVAAVAAGDVDAARELRCSAASDAIAQAPTLFTDQAKRLVEANGVPTVTGLRIVTSSGLQPMEPIPDNHELVITLRYGGGATGQIRLIIGRQNGRWRLCGEGTPQAPALAQARVEVPIGPRTATTPHDLMPAVPPAATVHSNRAQTFKHPPSLAAWTRAWRFGSYGGSRVTAARMRCVCDATSLVDRWLTPEYSDGVEQFTVPGVTGAVGLRYLGSAWLWIQTSTIGPYIDDVLIQRGSTVLDAAVADLPRGSNHDAVDLLAREVNRQADR
jgi:hypothetical protein